jgi:hypothetical protein
MTKESIIKPQVESQSIGDFARALSQGLKVLDGEPHELQPRSGPRINIERDQVKNGLAQLVLVLVKLLHELLERQALQRIESGTLDTEEIEQLGLALRQQAEEIERLRQIFGLDPEDLNLDLGSLGPLLPE